MDITSQLAVELPCPECGSVFHVSLGQILNAQEGMSVACEARGESECPAMYYAGLFDRESAQAVAAAFEKMEKEAQNAGGKLVFLNG